MIRNIFHCSQLQTQKTIIFRPICIYNYRKKSAPEILSYKERFDIKDGLYLLPKPPLKPLTAYNVFTLLYMKIIRENYPNEPTSVILKKLSSLWNDDEFMIDHKLEVLNLSKFQYDQYYKESLFYKKIYEKPKEPLSPYQIYLKEHYTTVQQNLKTNSIAEITRYITNEWHKMSSEEQDRYKNLFKTRYIMFKQHKAEWSDLFLIPFKKNKNIYNLYLNDHFKSKKQKFKDQNEHVAYAKQLQSVFNELSQEQKQIYEQIKKEDEDQQDKKIQKFMEFFDLSEQDFQDICIEAKSMQKQKELKINTSDSLYLEEEQLLQR